MRVLVCGGRDYGGADTVNVELGRLHREHGIACIIEGGARGADTLARQFAEAAGIPVETYAADWKGQRRAAGPIRNKRMLDEGKPDLVVAFPGGRGTANMVGQARKAGVRVLEICESRTIAEIETPAGGDAVS
jgi:hypothetical protein